MDISKIDYVKFDRPEILMFLFHPRPEWRSWRLSQGIEEFMIPVEKDIVIGGRFHPSAKSSPNILFFHGNGEIVADYDEVGPLYTSIGANFLPVDYRGYGRSTGNPTITNMMRDAHVIFDYVRAWLKDHSYSGPLIVMGRSLGSASALELAACYGTQIDAIIIESGFAYIRPLFTLLGLSMEDLSVSEEEGFRNIEKIRAFDKPTLIIHAEADHLLPFAEGQALYDASPAVDKKLLKIRGADHNDIFIRGMSEYMEAVEGLMEKLG